VHEIDYGGERTRDGTSGGNHFNCLILIGTGCFGLSILKVLQKVSVKFLNMLPLPLLVNMVKLLATKELRSGEGFYQYTKGEQKTVSLTSSF